MKLVDIILLSAIAILAILMLLMGLRIYKVSKTLSICENNESRFCYTITCPCDDQSKGPCNGYAYRSTGDGNFNCSFDPNIKVDSSGKIV